MSKSTAPNPAIKFIAPVAGIGAAWATRRLLRGTYRSVTGGEPPNAADPETSIRRALLWAAVTAATLAVVQVMVDRAVARASATSEQ